MRSSFLQINGVDLKDIVPMLRIQTHLFQSALKKCEYNMMSIHAIDYELFGELSNICENIIKSYLSYCRFSMRITSRVSTPI